MPRKANGQANGSARRKRKRERAREENELREQVFHRMAEQNGLEYQPGRGFRVLLDWYEWCLRTARTQIPKMLKMGSAMGWFYEQIEARERFEEKKATRREEAETQHEANLQYARARGLLQWVSQPVPDDFVCPYTGIVADKRKILSIGEPDSDAHDTLVSYRTGHRGRWYIAREVWDGTVDCNGNRLGVEIHPVPFGECTVTRPLGAPVPGLPNRGITGFSGQSGTPPPLSERGPRPDPIDPDVIVKTREGYRSEKVAIKAAMVHVLSGMMGLEHADLTRRSRLRGGARQGRRIEASAPGAETPVPVPADLIDHIVNGKASPTIPRHLWGGEVVVANAPHVRKEGRNRRKPEDSEDIVSLIRNNRIRALS